jgi:hypothetical protein
MTISAPAAPAPYPLRLEGRLDLRLSRWLWLVKWVLAIPHFVVLAFLWIGFVAATVAAFFAILVTGRYPRPLFTYTVGVLRWSWRVAHYSWSALGTDRYPPFTLDDDPDYPARLDVTYPQHLSRGLVLVKWWLLALPHYLVVGFLVGGGVWVAGRDDPWLGTASGGLIGVLVLVAAVVLAVTGRYPLALYDLVLGLNRWVYRVVAYAALMTDVYPPFRLDLGGHDPGHPATVGPPSVPGGNAMRGSPSGRATSWSGGRIALLVVGSVLALTSLGLLGAGGAALWADQTQRDADGYLATDPVSLTTTTSALVAEPIEVTLDQPGDAYWLRRALGTVRVEVQAPAGRELFVGLARSGDADRYLDGVAVDRVADVNGTEASYERRSGNQAPAPPAAQPFWVASASGSGTLDLDWDVRDGRWALVVMNADGTPGVAADVRAGATLPALTGLAVGLLVAGAALLALGTVLLVLAAVGARRYPPSGPEVPSPRGPQSSAPAPRTSAPGSRPMFRAPLPGS